MQNFAGDNSSTWQNLYSNYGITYTYEILDESEMPEGSVGKITIKRSKLQFGGITVSVPSEGSGTLQNGTMMSGSSVSYVAPEVWKFKFTISGSKGACQPSIGWGFPYMRWSLNPSATIESTITDYVTGYYEWFNNRNMKILKTGADTFTIESLSYGTTSSTASCPNKSVPTSELGRVNLQYNEIFEDYANGLVRLYK